MNEELSEGRAEGKEERRRECSGYTVSSENLGRRRRDEQCGVARKEVSKPARIGRPFHYGAVVSRYYASRTGD